jgi:hypothetical protein
MQRTPAPAATPTIRRKTASAGRPSSSATSTRSPGPSWTASICTWKSPPSATRSCRALRAPASRAPISPNASPPLAKCRSSALRACPPSTATPRCRAVWCGKCAGSTRPGQVLVKKAMEKLQLSARAYDRILKVAKTVADWGE